MAKRKKLILSKSQHIFLNELDTKFRAYVGGFGCLAGETMVLTEHGAKRIDSLESSVRVVSWNEKSQQFQLSLSGGAFPKNVGYLYRVTTQYGEFEASEHHRVLLSDGSYQRVDQLCVGDELSSYGIAQLQTKGESCPLELPLDVPHYSQTTVDWMEHYAKSARQYGQQLLARSAHDQAPVPLSGGVPLSEELCGNDSEVFGHEHNRQGQQTVHQSKSHSDCQLDHHEEALEETPVKRFFERIWHYSLRLLLSASSSEPHHTTSVEAPSHICSHLSSASIVSIERMNYTKAYYDLQVLDTNNYVTEDGVIHSNSGKTYVGCLDLLIFALRHKHVVQGYFGPSYGVVSTVFWPTLEEAAHSMGLTILIAKTAKEVIILQNGRSIGTIICRSMDRPETIIGFKIARALVDEIDTMSMDKARNAWRKIIARMRLVIPGVVNGIGVTCTPEGFLFVYHQFKKNPTKSYSMVQASTYENMQFLSDDYIDSLIETYPEQLVKAYIDGDFVNLTSGSVYSSFDRARHHTDRVVQDGERLDIGIDFNVGVMAATVYAPVEIIEGKPHLKIIGELSGYADTPALINGIKDKYPNHKISAFPDASGQSRNTTGATDSDHKQLKEAGFRLKANKSNPLIKERVQSVNRLFERGQLLVNTDVCPELTEALEQQIYDKNGSPDKSMELDDRLDSMGYRITKDYLISKPRMNYRNVI